MVIHPCSIKSDALLDDINKMLDRRHIGGLVLTPPLSEIPEVLAALSQRKLKFIRILSGKHALDNETPFIFIDERTAAYRLTQHLIELGHKTIAFLGGDETIISNHERFAGYQAAFNDNKLALDKKLLITGGCSFASGVISAGRLLSARVKPTAIFAGTAEIAAGTLFAARTHGLDVPQQLSIVSFEDNAFARQAWPNLTTTQQPNILIAQRATQLLIDSMRLNTSSHQKIVSEILIPELMVRHSTCAVPRRKA